jgi:DNA-binding SARP family transcriptional activator
MVYRGRLLPHDDGEGWTIAVREKLSARYVQLVRRLGERCEAEGRWEHAIALYRDGIEREPLGEPLYQGLMRCMTRLGREAEGTAVYRRLKDVLQRELAAAPSAQSRALAQQLRGEC